MFVLSVTVCPICHRFLDIHSRKMHGIDLDLYVRHLSSVHMSIESQSRTFYLHLNLKAILMYAIYVTVY